MSKLDKKNLGGKNECRRSNQLSHQFQNKGGWTKTFKNPKQRKG